MMNRDCKFYKSCGLEYCEHDIECPEFAVKEKPILFNTEMVKAILEGRKTVTRRIVKPKYCDSIFEMYNDVLCETEPKTPPVKLDNGMTQHKVRQFVPCKPPYKKGDILYVRETFCKLWKLDINDQTIEGTEEYFYRADGYNPTPYNHFPDENGYGGGRDCPRWSPSLHMPKEAARIFLLVKSVRAELLQDIQVSDIQDEGLQIDKKFYEESMNAHAVWFRGEFLKLWNSTIKNEDVNKYGFNANPWVWIIEFERISGGAQ